MKMNEIYKRKYDLHNLKPLLLIKNQ